MVTRLCLFHKASECKYMHMTHCYSSAHSCVELGTLKLHKA